MATLLNIVSKKQKTELPYDYSLSHHQLLFNAFIFIYATNMEIVFIKTNRMINLQRSNY
jgi:hypothetical protein